MPLVVGVVAVLLAGVLGVVVLGGGSDETGSDEAAGGSTTSVAPLGSSSTSPDDVSAEEVLDLTTTTVAEAEDQMAEGPPLGEPTAPPTGGWSSFDDELAANCHGGNMADCDYLYENIQGIQLPDSQPHKDYGATCGGRITQPANGNCVSWYGAEL